MNQEIDMSIFASDAVKALAVRQLKEMEDRHNFNRRQSYLLAVDNWKRNAARLAALQQPVPAVPQPPLAVHYRYLDDGEPQVTEGPDFVAPPYTPPAEPPKPSGIVEFGPALEDGCGGFLAGPNTTVPAGTLAAKDGKQYILVVIGRPGSINYRRHWLPIAP